MIVLWADLRDYRYGQFDLPKMLRTMILRSSDRIDTHFCLPLQAFRRTAFMRATTGIFTRARLAPEFA